MMNNVIEATILTGKFKGEDVLLPRIPMILTDMPFEFKRLQFPVRLAFAMTINKAQGQNRYKCHFKQLVAYEILLAHITYRCGKVLHLTLRKTSENDHQTISENLVKHGFAEHIHFTAATGKESIYVPG
ncbi:uncharacterized protein TNCV_5125411 [Trichonephila clavipes]|nr:uncharacterized protein TNCV_5125411 [Trichonephila clavipes]